MAGRKLVGKEKKEKYCICLGPGEKEFIENLGNGSLTGGIRRLMDFFKTNKSRSKTLQQCPFLNPKNMK